MNVRQQTNLALDSYNEAKYKKAKIETELKQQPWGSHLKIHTHTHTNPVESQNLSTTANKGFVHHRGPNLNPMKPPPMPTHLNTEGSNMHTFLLPVHNLILHLA